MVASMIAEKVSKSYLSHLKAQIKNSPVKQETLVIAHNDSTMVHALSIALQHKAVVLEVPQSEWDFATGELQEVIKWATHLGGFKNIVLAGHCFAVAEDCPASFQNGQHNESAATQGAKRAQWALQESKRHFSEQLATISGNREIRIQAEQLNLYGLFYVAASGVFMNYDLDTGAFQPVV